MDFKQYPSYKDSGVKWLGQIPDHWDSCNLKFISKIYAGGTPDRNRLDYWVKGEIPWINSGAVNQVIIKEPSEYITELGLKNSSAKYIPVNSLVMALAGQGKTKGMVAYTSIETTCNQSMAAIVPKNYHYKFLYYWLDSNYQNIRNLTGGDNRDGLNLAVLSNIPCPKISIVEQTQIVSFLDSETSRIDNLIAKQEKLIEKLEEHRKSVISHAVTKGLDPNVPMKDSGSEWLGEVPEHWSSIAIKFLATEKNSLFIDGDWIESKDISDEGIKYITTGNVSIGAYKEKGSGFISDKTFYELSCKEVFENDILISRLNLPVGRSCLVPNLNCRVVTSVDNVIFRPDAKYSREYLVYLFSSLNYLYHTETLARGATMQRISRTLLGDIRISIPELQEQNKIVSFLDSETSRIDNLIAKQEKLIEKLKEYRTSIISHAVTGKIDVRDLVA